MRIGGRRHVVNVEQITRGAADSYSVRAETWTDYMTGVWVSIEPQAGREYYRAKQVTPEITHLVGMLYDAGITTDKRLKFGSRTLDIVFVDNVDEANWELWLHCVEQV